MTAFVDELAITIVFSPAHRSHVKGWFNETLCGKYINYWSGWKTGSLTSLAYLGRIANDRHRTLWCKTCINNYKDINAD